MAIFLTKVAYIGIQIPYWAILKNVDIKVKPDVATFGATFGKYWSTFIPTSGHADETIVKNDIQYYDRFEILHTKTTKNTQKAFLDCMPSSGHTDETIIVERHSMQRH